MHKCNKNVSFFDSLRIRWPKLTTYKRRKASGLTRKFKNSSPTSAILNWSAFLQRFFLFLFQFLEDEPGYFEAIPGTKFYPELELNYQEVGSGDHYILLLPDALGTCSFYLWIKATQARGVACGESNSKDSTAINSPSLS